MVTGQLKRAALLFVGFLVILPLLAQLPSITSPPDTSSGGGTAAALATYSGTGLTITAGTYFLPFGGGAAASSTEASVSNGIPVQATIKNLYVQQSAAIGTGNTATYTIRKNGADQAVTCVIADSSTTCADNNNSFTVLGGDVLDYELVTTGTIVVTPNIMVSVGLTSVVVPPSPSFSLVSSLAQTSPSGNGFTSSAIDTTGATLLVVVVGEQGGPIALGVTDSKGNSYTPLSSAGLSGFVNGQMFYCISPIVGTGHTFSVTTSGSTFPAVAVEAWNVAGTVTFGSQSGANALQPGSIGATGTTLFVTGATWNPFTSPVTVDSGFTISSQAPSTATSVGIAISHIVASASKNPTWSGPGSGVSVMGTYK